jgi:hypothetical protein
VLPQSGKGIKNKHQTKKKEHLIRLKKIELTFHHKISFWKCFSKALSKKFEFYFYFEVICF